MRRFEATEPLKDPAVPITPGQLGDGAAIHQFGTCADFSYIAQSDPNGAPVTGASSAQYESGLFREKNIEFVSIHHKYSSTHGRLTPDRDSVI